MTRITFAAVAFLAGAITLAAQESRPIPSSGLDAALKRAGKNRSEIERALAACEGEESTGMRFLVTWMPESDLKALSADFLIKNVKLAYEARKAAPWRTRMSEELFLDAVLPYAHVDEARDPCRAELRRRCLPMIADCKSPAEAATRLNEKVFSTFKVRYSTKRRRANQCAKETMATGTASCTGLSILLADACRAVGVPARLAGIPKWANKRGNHTWVEIWDGGWHFTGAAEPDKRGLNHAWFQADAAQAVEGSGMTAIYAVSYKSTGKIFPLVWSPRVDWVHGVDVTSRYAPKEKVIAQESTRLMIRVLDRAGGDRVAAAVEVLDPARPKSVLRGMSRDESFDTNDILSFDVARDSALTIVVEHAGRRITKKRSPGKKAEEIVTVLLASD